MTESADGRRRDEIVDDSDRLLGQIRRLRELEEEKRDATMSSPEFHALAERVEREAREVFRTAADERRTGDELSETQDVSTNDAAGDA